MWTDVADVEYVVVWSSRFLPSVEKETDNLPGGNTRAKLSKLAIRVF